LNFHIHRLKPVAIHEAFNCLLLYLEDKKKEQQRALTQTGIIFYHKKKRRFQNTSSDNIPFQVCAPKNTKIEF
jgi:hypothetical protein